VKGIYRSAGQEISRHGWNNQKVHCRGLRSPLLKCVLSNMIQVNSDFS